MQVMCIVDCMVYNETAYALASLIRQAATTKQDKKILKEKGCQIGINEENWQPVLDNLDKDAEIWCESEKWSYT